MGLVVVTALRIRNRNKQNKDEKDKFELNEYGIGYVSESTYRQGFRPKVEKAGKDITNDIIRSISFLTLAHGIIDGKVIRPYKYLSFRVPGQSTDSLPNDILGLIERNAIDTTRLIEEQKTTHNQKFMQCGGSVWVLSVIS